MLLAPSYDLWVNAVEVCSACRRHSIFQHLICLRYFSAQL